MSNANELAHPVALESYPARDGDYTKHEVTGGLTKRERIALAALQGLIAGEPEIQFEEAAKHAVGYADALLAELERTA